MNPKFLKDLKPEDRKDITKFYLGLLHTSIHARMGMLPSISALCATLLVLATFNNGLLPLNNIVKMLLSVLLVIIPIALFFYNSQLKKEQNSYIKTLGESVASTLNDKIVGYFPDFVIYLISTVIAIVIYLIWAY